MSEAHAHKLSYVEESTRGITPTNPRFRSLPDNRTTLAATKDLLATERLTGSRIMAAPRTGATVVGGDIPVDLSSGTYDDFIASALQSSWVDDAGAAAATADITIDGAASNGVAVGDTFPTATGTVLVESIDAKQEELVLVFDSVDPAEPTETFEFFGNATLEIDGAEFVVVTYTDVVQSATIIASDARKSFSILREFSDFAEGEEPFMLLKGCEVSTWALTAAANGLAKSTFTFFGQSQDGPMAASPEGTSFAPAIDTEPFDTFSGSMEIDGNKECIVTDYNLTLNNGHAARYTVGCANSQDAMVGMSVIEGSITVYFNNARLYKKFINEERLALKLTLADSQGNAFAVNLPNLKIGSGSQPDVTGDGSLTLPISFTAHKDDILGSHISVQRISTPTA